MIILGIDPGTLKTGFGIINYEKNDFTLLDSGVIKPPKSKELAPRLSYIYKHIIDLISKHQPDEFSIETAFYGKNFQSAMKLGQARGIAFLAADQNNMVVNEYSPKEIKRAVVGNGSASKEQVQYMVAKMFNLEKELESDESDAVATAVCHALRITSVVSNKGSWKNFIKNNPDRIIE